MSRRVIQRVANVAYLHCSKLITLVCFSTLLYLKFFLLWAMVILADFILEFRFEFLWPFWLLLRSVYDSFKYQGLVSVDVALARTLSHIMQNLTVSLSFSLSLFQAFSVFFICIALTSDMICFFFIPVHWLFFAASTYVWVQYVWHTGMWKTNFVRVVGMNNGVMYIYIKIYDFSY